MNLMLLACMLATQANVNKGLAVDTFTLPAMKEQTQINIDVARFKGDEPNMSRCEIYIGFPCYILEYRKDNDGKLSAKFKIKASIKTDSGKLVDEGELDRISYVNSLEEAKTRNSNILEQMEIMLNPGTYTIDIEVSQSEMPRGGLGATGIEMVKKTSHWKASREIEIRKPEKTLYLSDIQLSSSIDTISGTGKFVKNGLNVIPLPQRIIGEPYSMLYAYSEIYNLIPKTDYEVKYKILNDTGTLVTEKPFIQYSAGEDGRIKDSLKILLTSRKETVVAELPAKTLPASTSDLTEIDALNIKELAAGNYILKIEISQGKNKIIKKKGFIVTKLFPKQEPQKSMANPEDLKYASMIQYIATSEDMKTYNKLSDTGKQAFVNDYWKKRGADTLREFIARMKYADAAFSSPEEKGRDSDLGRIWIKYGKPDDMEKFSQDPTYNNAEKWSYYRGQGIIFIFVDKTGYGKYRLTYSSIKEEITDPNYKHLISPELLQ